MPIAGWSIIAATSVAAGDVSGTVILARPLSLVSLNSFNQFDSNIYGGVMSASGAPIVVKGPTEDLLTMRDNLQSFSLQCYSVGVTSYTGVDKLYSGVMCGHDGQVDGYVYSYVTEKNRDRQTLRLFAVAFETSLILGFLAFILIWSFMRVVLRQIARLDAGAQRVRCGQYDVRLSAHSNDELGKLTETFNSMVLAIDQTTKSLRGKVLEQKNFLNYIVHELKAPLSAINWTTELLLEGDTDNPEVKKGLQEIQQVNERMRQLVNDLLELARMDRGVIDVNPEKLDITAQIDSAIRAISGDLKERGLTLDWQAQKKSLSVSADSYRLQQVLTNLLSNSIRYSKDGGTISVSVTTVDRSAPDGYPGEYVRVAVGDDGIGIPKDEQKDIFLRFFRASNAEQKTKRGTGLGLFITKYLVHKHGGDIWFKSEEGQGSTFYFTLPLAK